MKLVLCSNKCVLTYLQADGSSHEVSPSLAHTSGFESVEAVGICWTSRQTVRQTVGVLVNNHTSLKATIAVRRSLGPDVHAHTRKLTIRRRREISIVSTRPILRVQNDLVVAQATLTIVVDLATTLAS